MMTPQIIKMKAEDALQRWGDSPEWITALGTTAAAAAVIVPQRWRWLAVSATVLGVFLLHARRPAVVSSSPPPASTPTAPTIAVGEPSPMTTAALGGAFV